MFSFDSHNQREADEPSERIRGGQELFYEQEAFPFETIRTGARERALEYVREKMTPGLKQAEQSAAASPQVTGSIWVPFGPDSFTYSFNNLAKFDRSGRLTAVAIDSNNSNVIYAGGSLGGVWKTTNGGSSWTPLTDFQPTLSTGSIALDPANSNIVYVGTGDKNLSGFNYFGAGILKSTNGGASFTQLAADTFRGVSIGDLAIDPSNPQALYAAVSTGFAGGSAMVDPPTSSVRGIYKSVDGGETWSRLTGAPVGDVTELRMHPSNPQIIYAAYNSFTVPTLPGGIYRTTDAGVNWTRLSGSGFPASGFGRVSFSLAPSVPQTIYAALEKQNESGSDLLSLLKSTDGGSTWVTLTRPVSGYGNPKVCICNFTNVMTVSPTDPNLVFFGGISLYRSTDGGLSWTDVTFLSQQNSSTGGTQGDLLAVQYDPNNSNRVVIGCDGGIFTSSNNGSSWISLNGNLSLTQFYYIAADPTDANHLLGGAQDKGVLIRTTNNTWDYSSTGGDGGDMQIDFANPNTLYHPDIFMSFERSDDGGRTWQKKETGLDKTDRSIFIMPVTMDPSNSQTLYLGSYRLYKTNNRADGWSAISGDLTKGTDFANNSNIRFHAISAIAVAPSSPSTIYVGTSDGNLQISTNGGSTFSNLTSGLPLRYISRIAVDPANSNFAYVSVSGFGGGHVFKTVNGGANWTDISGNLPDIPVNALVLDSSASNKLYVGTDIGVFLTTDGGIVWFEVGADTLPNSPVFDLKINNYTNSLFAATFGRGVFRLGAAKTVQFSASDYTVGEGDGRVNITLTRSGDTTSSASVSFATNDAAGLTNCNVFNGIASPRCDYINTLGTLTFGAGETFKSFSIAIVDDSYAEGNETFTVSLNNPAGATLGTQSTATVTIIDNDVANGANPADQAGFFVRQHYLDFLSREPDASGLAFWTNEITSCGSNAQCIEVKRINVSAAFYLSIEFQGTVYLVERIYKTAYGDASGTSTFGGTHQLSVPVVRLSEFLPDTQEIGNGVIVNQPGWEQVLENNKQAFTSEFVQRSRFTTAFPASMTAAQFVDTLNTNAGGPLSQSERNQLVSDLSTGAKTRARVIRAVAEDPDLNNAEFNRAFVLMQYFGYLRRNPNDPQDTDYTGYDFWLTKLNQFNGNFQNAEMVKAFISSGEYRQRFGP